MGYQNVKYICKCRPWRRDVNGAEKAFEKQTNKQWLKNVTIRWNKKILPFGTACVDLEDTVLSGKNQTQKYKNEVTEVILSMSQFLKCYFIEYWTSIEVMLKFPVYLIFISLLHIETKESQVMAIQYLSSIKEIFASNS